MMTPAIVCFVLLIVAVVANFASREKLVVYYVLFPALMSLFLLLLFNNYGIDVPAYKSFYAEIEPIHFWEHHTDIGYGALMGLVQFFGGGFYVFLTVINIAALFLIFKSFDRYSPYIALSWLMYFVLFIGYHHTVLRQGIAIAITIYSLRYIIDRNLKLFLLLVVVAATMHSSALLFLPAYWIAKLRWSNKTMFILLCLTFPFVFLDMVGVIAKVAGMAGVNEGLVKLYFEKEGVLYERAGLSLGLGVRVLFYLFFALTYKREDRVQHVLFNLYSVYLMFYFPLSSVSMLSARGLDYYKVFECIMVPYALLNARSVYSKIGIVAVVLGYYIYALPKQYTIFEVPLDSALLNLIKSF